MSKRLNVALCVLQWVLGIVILVQSLRFVFSSHSAQAFAKTGLPEIVHLGLGYAEIVAAVLFLIPPIAAAGGRLLITVLAAAILIHLLHGWFDVGGLLVYAAAAWAVVAAKSSAVTP